MPGCQISGATRTRTLTNRDSEVQRPCSAGAHSRDSCAEWGKVPLTGSWLITTLRAGRRFMTEYLTIASGTLILLRDKSVAAGDAQQPGGPASPKVRVLRLLAQWQSS